jgi:hypothetical protein
MAELKYGGAVAGWLKKNMPIQSQAKYVEYGFGQVEPNHLSAQRTAQVYAQLPANKDIELLEQGQFVKYDYATHTNGIGEVNFTGAGEWMLVYNEIKLYREGQLDCEFAMLKDNYQARIYSPYDYRDTEDFDVDGNSKRYRSKWLNGVDSEGNDSITLTDATGKTLEYKFDDVTADVPDYYEKGWTNDPFVKLGVYKEHRMPAGATMVPRVFKTNVGDIFTTNTINEETVALGDILAPSKENGILCKGGDLDSMKWQAVKIYTMPDGQKGVKVMRIA